MKKLLMTQLDVNRWFIWTCCLSLLLFAEQAAAASGAAGTTMTLGTMASTITGSFTNLTKLITAGSYLAGVGFSVSAIMKFKQHKDNPSQVQIGTPIAMVFIAAALLFLPSLLGITGNTIFGVGGGETGGPLGTTFTSGS